MASPPPPDIQSLIAGLARALRARDIGFMLIGGQAVLLHGGRRIHVPNPRKKGTYQEVVTLIVRSAGAQHPAWCICVSKGFPQTAQAPG